MSPLALPFALATEEQDAKKCPQIALRSSLTFCAAFIFTLWKH